MYKLQKNGIATFSKNSTCLLWFSTFLAGNSLGLHKIADLLCFTELLKVYAFDFIRYWIYCIIHFSILLRKHPSDFNPRPSPRSTRMTQIVSILYVLLLNQNLLLFRSKGTDSQSNSNPTVYQYPK